MTKVRSIGLAAVLLLVALAGCRSAQTTSAILYIDQKQFDKAVKVLHEGLDYNPEEPDAFFYLGEAHSKLADDAITKNDYLDARKNYELAYKYYSRARELDAKKFGDNVKLALLHNYTLRSNDAKNEYGGKFYEMAEGYFRLAYAALPDSISPIKNIARMKVQQATEIRDDPKLVDNPQLKAAADSQQTKLLTEALDLLDQVLKQRPDAYVLQMNKATVLGRLGRNQEAQAIYAQLLEQHPEDTDLVTNMANLAVDDRNFARAAELYAKLAGLLESDNDPSNDDQIKGLQVQAATWLAQKDVKRYPEAIDLFKKAQDRELVREQPTLFGLLQALYSYGTELKSQAEADSTKRAELTPKATAAFKEGVEVGTGLVEQYPDSRFGYYYLGLCQLETGDSSAAEASLKKFQDLEGASGTP